MITIEVNLQRCSVLVDSSSEMRCISTTFQVVTIFFLFHTPVSEIISMQTDTTPSSYESIFLLSQIIHIIERLLFYEMNLKYYYRLVSNLLVLGNLIFCYQTVQMGFNFNLRKKSKPLYIP